MNLHMMGMNDDQQGAEENALGQGIEGESAFGALSIGGTSKKSHALHGFGALAIVVVVGVGVLFGMRKLGMGGLIDMPDVTIDYPIDQADSKVATADAQEIISDLNASGDIDQVPLDEITQNPFEWKGVVAAADDASTVLDPTELAAQRAREAAEARRREIESAFNSLTLNGVMGSGPSGVARISGDLVRVGDMVDEMFTVKSISGRSVQLEVDGKQYLLALGE